MWGNVTFFCNYQFLLFRRKGSHVLSDPQLRVELVFFLSLLHLKHLMTGGGENIAEMTFNKYDTGFLGCVRKVYFKTRKIKLQADASGGWNVIPCDG